MRAFFISSEVLYSIVNVWCFDATIAEHTVANIVFASSWPCTAASRQCSVSLSATSRWSANDAWKRVSKVCSSFSGYRIVTTVKARPTCTVFLGNPGGNVFFMGTWNIWAQRSRSILMKALLSTRGWVCSYFLVRNFGEVHFWSWWVQYFHRLSWSHRGKQARKWHHRIWRRVTSVRVSLSSTVGTQAQQRMNLGNHSRDSSTCYLREQPLIDLRQAAWSEDLLQIEAATSDRWQWWDVFTGYRRRGLLSMIYLRCHMLDRCMGSK